MDKETIIILSDGSQCKLTPKALKFIDELKSMGDHLTHLFEQGYIEKTDSGYALTQEGREVCEFKFLKEFFAERGIPEEEIPLYLTELRARAAKMQRYKVYHRDNPSFFVIVNNDGYFPLEIRSKAIKFSDLFDQSEWSKLAVRRIDK